MGPTRRTGRGPALRTGRLHFPGFAFRRNRGSRLRRERCMAWTAPVPSGRAGSDPSGRAAPFPRFRLSAKPWLARLRAREGFGRDCSSPPSPLASLAGGSSQRAPDRSRVVRLKETARLSASPSINWYRCVRPSAAGAGTRALRALVS